MSETIVRTTSELETTDRPHPVSTRQKLADWTIIAAAVALGLGSILLFAAVDAIPSARLELPTAHPLWWDTALSLLFFVQHSGMVRRGFRARLAAIMPARYHGAVYSIASGIVLTAVVLLWQPTPPLIVLTGVALWISRVLTISAATLFVWTVISSSHDMFGVQAIRRHILGRPDPPIRFFATGAYAVVRHPFYACVLVLLWSETVVTADRLLLSVTWTIWIVGATFFEERDLIADFGDAYSDYRRRVPMLVPWRGRVRLAEP